MQALVRQARGPAQFDSPAALSAVVVDRLQDDPRMRIGPPERFDRAREGLRSFSIKHSERMMHVERGRICDCHTGEPHRLNLHELVRSVLARPWSCKRPGTIPYVTSS